MLAIRSNNQRVSVVYELRDPERNARGWTADYRIIWLPDRGAVAGLDWHTHGGFRDDEHTFLDAPEPEPEPEPTKWTVTYTMTSVYDVVVTGVNETEATENFWSQHWDGTSDAVLHDEGEPQGVKVRRV